MKFVFGICEFIGIVLLWSGCGYITQKIKLLDETRMDLDMAVEKLKSMGDRDDIIDV